MQPGRDQTSADPEGSQRDGQLEQAVDRLLTAGVVPDTVLGILPGIVLGNRRDPGRQRGTDVVPGRVDLRQDVGSTGDQARLPGLDQRQEHLAVATLDLVGLAGCLQPLTRIGRDGVQQLVPAVGGLPVGDDQ